MPQTFEDFDAFVGQFRAAGLNQFNCSYSSIHDFSARSASPVNYAFLPLSDDISKHVRLPKDLEAEISSGDGTVGKLPIWFDEHSLSSHCI